MLAEEEQRQTANAQIQDGGQRMSPAVEGDRGGGWGTPLTRGRRESLSEGRLWLSSSAVRATREKRASPLRGCAAAASRLPCRCPAWCERAGCHGVTSATLALFLTPASTRRAQEGTWGGSAPSGTGRFVGNPVCLTRQKYQPRCVFTNTLSTGKGICLRFGESWVQSLCHVWHGANYLT